jgi:hypothetical protein
VLYLIAHAPWAPGREASLARLRERLPPSVVVLASRGPEHAAIWARRVWEKAARHDGPVCILNDDVRVDVDAIERAHAAVPDEPLSLCANNPNVLQHPGAPWIRCYHYSGPGVVLPKGAAADLLSFVYTLPWSVLSRMNEDNIAIEWAWSRQRPFWYPLPSPVSHDVSVPSTLGYDNHPHRDSVALGPARDFTVADKDAVPFVELSWADTRALRLRREILRAGSHICAFCVTREGVVGNGAVMVCLSCLSGLTNTVARAHQ